LASAWWCGHVTSHASKISALALLYAVPGAGVNALRKRVRRW